MAQAVLETKVSDKVQTRREIFMTMRRSGDDRPIPPLGEDVGVSA